MDRCEPRSAVVTGASQGIGNAIAVALARQGVATILAGRSVEKLDTTRKQLADDAVRHRCMKLDLADLSDIARFSDEVKDKLTRLDILINCAGAYDRGSLVAASADRLDELYKTNVRGVIALTTELLPLLKSARGDIVFINSSVVFSTATDAGLYAATKHALLGATNALRAEVNDDGVRVLTVYPGRTATPLQRDIFTAEGREYQPDLLLQPSDVADIVVACLSLPATAEVIDLSIRPRHK